MNRWILAMLPFAGCAVDRGPTGPLGRVEPETDTDTDTDTDADTDADSDTDPTGDSETGRSDTGPTDTGTGPTCRTRDLVRTMSFRDVNGACTTCSPDGLEFVLGLENPCPTPLTLTTGHACLSDDWVAHQPSTGETLILFRLCPGSTTTWTIPVGGRIEDAVAPGPMSSGTWNVEAMLDVPAPVPTVGTFTLP